MECDDDNAESPTYSFSVVCKTGPWWGTKWSGEFNLERQFCYLDQHPRHPHVTGNELCVRDLPDRTLLTWVQALITLWHETNWGDAWKLRKCVEEMIDGLERDEQACTPDLLSEFTWIKRALKRCDKHDHRIHHYRKLIKNLKKQ